MITFLAKSRDPIIPTHNEDVNKLNLFTFDVCIVGNMSAVLSVYFYLVQKVQYNVLFVVLWWADTI